MGCSSHIDYQMENERNWNTASATAATRTIDIAKYDGRFVARKIIRRLKKMLKWNTKATFPGRTSTETYVEEKENLENEILERRLLENLECEQNWSNENCQNCYMCSVGVRDNFENHSICLVFMPGEAEPVPVKLRHARIPGGFTYVEPSQHHFRYTPFFQQNSIIV